MIEVAGGELHWRMDGPADAPVVMLANSLGTTLGMWDSQVPALTRRFRVLRYDMCGHGASSVPDAPFDIERLGRDAVALLDALELSRVHFCGLSLGGAVGMWLGAHARDRLHKLVLCNTAAAFGPASLWDARIEAVARGGMAAIAEAVLDRWFTAEFRQRDPAAVERVRQMLLTTRPEGYIPACAAVRNADQRANVVDVRAPTLVIAGARDSATPPSEGRWLAEHIAGARYAELPAAHLSNIEATPLFNESVLRFIAGQGE
ncbi:3-oxoadipate enol-lactonase [Sorangium sp. So ce726]|uniref:3-oxoadipate enol-lactonase n=1 Tax=Sorangium sp. So ce726 TaxID=3133319 RepID=UPI003F637645